MKKRQYKYIMSEVEYDEYLENYLSYFITKDFEKLSLNIYDNYLDSEYLLNVVNQLDNSFQHYNLIFDQIIQIKSNGFEDINEVKKVAICKLLKLNKIELLLYYFKTFNNKIDFIKNIFDEDMLTRLIFSMINKIKLNSYSFLLFNLEDIFKNMFKLDCFNKFHKTLLLKNFNNNNLIDRIMLKNHNFKQQIYKLNCTNEEVLKYFNFK